MKETGIFYLVPAAAENPNTPGSSWFIDPQGGSFLLDGKI